MKKNVDIARAWRDQDYYLNLTEEERASLGTHPAGALADPALRSITGGCGTVHTYDCSANCEYTVNTTGICTYCPPEYCQ